MEEQKFYPGQKVKCVRTWNQSMRAGEIYTVANTHGEFVRILEYDSAFGFVKSRFIPAAEFLNEEDK